MHFPVLLLLACVLLLGAGVVAAPQTLSKDVIIIGGGAAGTYAATALRSMGRSFTLIEKKPQLGGHTETFVIPRTNLTVDYGVQGYTALVNSSFAPVQRFLGAYNVPIAYSHRSETGGAGTTRYFDFSTGRELNNFTFSTDLSAYRRQANKYPYLGYQVETPQPIPGDFLLSFGDFVTKYSLQDEVFNIYYNVEGLGDPLSLPAYYILRELNLAHLISLAPGGPGSAITADHDNQGTYLRAQAAFGTDALVSSMVQSAQRDPNGVTVTVQTPSGQRTIKAPKLLVAMPPIPANMAPLGLDSTESGLFNKFTFSGWYSGLVNATGFPPGVSFQNAAPNTQYNLPQLPALYQISNTSVPDVYLVRYGAPGNRSADQVEAETLSTIQRIRAAVVPHMASLPPVRILTFANQNPYNVHVTAADLKAGFNNQLGALQGHRSTWYSSETFFGSSSSDIWNATQGVVESMLAA